jgi:type II secretory pathway pseudopilin PulG
MKPKAPPRRGGFFIIELLMTISLLVFVFAAAGQLFRATILTAAASDRAANQASRLDDLLRALRRDLWQAADIHVTDPHAVELTAAEGHEITWRINPDNSADRSTSAGPPNHWSDIGLQLQFIRAESGLVLTHSGPPENQRILLVSQVMLGRAR